MPLTNKQKLFCKEYIIDFNGTQAAIRAGYSKKCAKQDSCRMLTYAYLSKYISKLLKPKLDKLDITVESILKDIIEIKERCMQKVPIMEWDKKAGKKMPTGEWEFDASAALKATEQLAKYKKMFTDKIEHSSGEFIVKFMDAEEKNI